MALVNGSATSPTTNLDAGDHVISADYQGDAKFAGASANLDQEVEAAQTTTTVTSSPNPSVFGQVGHDPRRGRGGRPGHRDARGGRPGS